MTSAWLCRRMSRWVSAIYAAVQIGPVLALTGIAATVQPLPRAFINGPFGRSIRENCGENAGEPPVSELESLAQVESAHVRVGGNVLGAALHQHLAGVDDVGTVGQADSASNGPDVNGRLRRSDQADYVRSRRRLDGIFGKDTLFHGAIA